MGRQRVTGLFFYKERLGTESPPHQSPSVTAFPQGEASGLCSPTRKSAPNQGTYMGPEIAPRPEQCGTIAKTSEWERAAPKPGGGGGPPPRLFASGLSLEKAWIPARDRAGTHVAGPTLRRSPRNRLPMTEAPRRAGGPPGRCAPRWLRSHPPVGYAVPPAGNPNPKIKPLALPGVLFRSAASVPAGRAQRLHLPNLGAQRQRVPNFKSFPSSHYTPPRPGRPGCSGWPRCCTPRGRRSARRR